MTLLEIPKESSEVNKPIVPPLNTLSDFSNYHFVPEKVEKDHVSYPKGENNSVYNN